VIGVSLETPEKIRTLQRKLYSKAKEAPEYRFYLLYDKIYREDILKHSWALVKANAGAPGVDGESFEQIELAGLEEWLSGIGKQLRERTYKPKPVRRVMIPKAGGGERPLGIPTIRDRVVQTATKLVIEPIFEADLEPDAYGYRPRRSAQDAIEKVHQHICDGYTDVVDADLSKYFDTIPHGDLMKSVARRIVDRDVLHLIKMWLTVAIEERGGDGKRLYKGGRRRIKQQGGVISPLLANIYMNRFLKYWKQTERARQFRAKIVTYADDFVILSCGHAQEAMEWTQSVMTKLRLTMNEAKTALRNARREPFDFLGYTFGPHCYVPKGSWYLGASPSQRSIRRLKGKVYELLQPQNVGEWTAVRDRLNRMLTGWSNYFSYGTRAKAYQSVDLYVAERVRHFLRRRHNVSWRGTARFTTDDVFGRYGVIRLRQL
jgi:RNA-directed DNA polymerase